MNSLLKNKIIISLGWSLHIAVITAMILYMTYMEIIFSIGLVIFIAIIIPAALVLTLQKLKIIPPDNDSSARFISKYGHIFGLFSHFFVFYLYLSFYQTVVSLLIGVVIYGGYFLLKKVFTDKN